ncbi:hypothetical protein FV232_03030 [Methylobacterium sp. WL30]|uniref:hypothetical protein n=1 Tax=unclassified Methylobacterium TaxID=2615210 RepID=UPI0011C82262|nr:MULTISPECIES: hypothetical protein [unclassified Methylobacterium]TXN51386.1 hypothetical protein FV227_08165 [Methylobacterium sp. WL119]TXN70068.1 hypothetical protein FV232_03030 [Methylobacterium sp. WL30]
MSKPDPFAALDGGGSGRLSLPFLPTLVTALVLGAGSLICREPAPTPPAPVPAASVAPHAFHAAAPVEAALPRLPAAIAFAQVPPSFVLPEIRTAAAPHPVARVATAAPLRRACTAPRCAEGPPRRPDPFSEIVRSAPVEAQAQAQARDGLLPDLALPFAPAARVVGDAAAYLRSGASSLGSSVALLVDRLN